MCCALGAAFLSLCAVIDLLRRYIKKKRFYCVPTHNKFTYFIKSVARLSLQQKKNTILLWFYLSIDIAVISFFYLFAPKVRTAFCFYSKRPLMLKPTDCLFTSEETFGKERRNAVSFESSRFY